MKVFQEIAKHPWAESCRSVFFDWVKKCTMTHVTWAPLSSGQLPKRLIYVGGEEDQHLELVSPNET